MRWSIIIRSARTIAVTASSTTGTLKAMHKSCLPFTEKSSCSLVSQFHVCCSLGVEEVGFTAILNTKSFPLVYPPTTPPAWFVFVLPVPSIIASLCFNTLRFTDLLREVEGISGKMLSRELKNLEENQLVTRTVLNTQPITVEYQLTEYGHTLKEVIDSLAKWGANHHPVRSGRALVQDQTRHND